MSEPDDFSYSHWDDFPRYIWGQLKTPTYNWRDAEITALLNKGYKDMEASVMNVENLIQQTKDQNGRVYQKLREMENHISNLERAAKEYRGNNLYPNETGTGHISSLGLLSALMGRIGTKGILKMLAER